MDLIPDLPHEIALQCLIRVPFNQFHSFRSVSKDWEAQIRLPEFLQLRKSAGKTQTLVVLSQARVDPTRNLEYSRCLTVPVYRLVVLEPETGSWSELPVLPEFSNGLPMFCRMVAVGSDLVVMGGYDPNTWEALDWVFVFDFLSSTWRRGKGMPGGRRSFFGCAADGDRTVVVAGGHDGEKNALKSGWAYDVAEDTWVRLPDMAEERDECKVVFHRGKFHVIGGYSTEMQGRFHVSGEIFDVATWQWSETSDVLLELGKCCVEGDDERLYGCLDANVVLQEGDKWNYVARLPADVANVTSFISCHEKVCVIGNSEYGGSHNAYLLDLNTRTWIKVDSSLKYSGHIQSGCCLVI